MFTPTIKSIEKRNGSLRLIVNYFDGINDIQDEIFITSVQDLKQTMINRSQQLTDLYTFANSFNIGVVDISASIKII